MNGTTLTSGALRGERVELEDGGVGYCIWYPMPGMDDAGLCFDIAAEDIDDMITLLERLRDGETTDAKAIDG